jgi:antigen flippase
MKNTAWVYLSTSFTNLLCLFLGMVSGILSARLLGPQGRGELAIISYFPNLMGTFCCLAIPQALSFFISREPGRAAEIAAAGLRLATLLGLLGAVGFALAAPYSLTADNRHLARAVMLACLVAPTMVLYPFMSAIYQGMHSFSWVNGMQILVAGGYVLFILGFWWTNHVSALWFFLAAITLQILTIVLYAWRLGLKSLGSRVTWETYRACVVQGLKFFMPVVAMTLFIMSDRAILIRTTNLEEIGYYAIAFSLTYPLVVCAGSFVQIGFVEMAGTSNSLASASLMARRFHMAQAVVVGAMMILLPLAYPVIRYGFGSKFLPALPATYLMAVAMSFQALNRVLENNLRAKDLAWPGVLTSLGALPCVIILGILWTPEGGAAGFSLAYLCAQGVGSTILIFIVCRVMSVSLSDLWGLRPRILAGFARSLWQLIFIREVQT